MKTLFDVFLSYKSEDDDGAFDPRATRRFVGWGPVIGEPGSAISIAQDGLRSVAINHDKAKPPSLIFQEIQHVYPEIVEPENLQGWLDAVQLIHGKDWRRMLARLAPAVISASQRGDQTATKIVTDAAAAFAETVRLAIHTSGHRKVAVVLQGPLFTRSQFYAALVQDRIRTITDGQVGLAAYSPAVGALLLARSIRAVKGLPTLDTILESVLRLPESLQEILVVNATQADPYGGWHPFVD